MPKHRIIEKVEDLDICDTPIENAIKLLTELQAVAAERGYFNCYIQYDGENYLQLMIEGSRYETDKEQEMRERREQRAKDKQDLLKAENMAKEKKEYERLRKKYGNQGA